MDNLKKRKYSEFSDSDSYPMHNKKSKLFNVVDDDMIYSVGNEIHFTSEINKDSIEAIIKKITKIIHKNEKDFSTKGEKLKIAYIVDSPGGCVTSILKFVDFINMCRIKHKNVEFVSIITGLVASAGTIMCIVADKRMMTKNAHAMIHELSSGSRGKYTHFISYSKFLNSLHNKLVDIYLEGSKKTKQEIEALLTIEKWYSAEEYLDAGFVDEVIANVEVGKSAISGSNKNED